MTHSMRWFGPSDTVSLMDIRQAGCTEIVTALHHIPVGEVWTVEEIKKRQLIVEADNQTHSTLKWTVVESLPVHEDIKKNLPKTKNYIEKYIISIQNLAACGIYTVCYNFMPVLDWSRTQLNYTMPDGSKALRFEWIHFAVFDIFILRRPYARQAYSVETIAEAEKVFAKASPEFLKTLQNTALLGLPGAKEAFELDKFQSLLDAYADIDSQKLKSNLHSFIQQVAPKASKKGVNLCIHPDDPPFPLLGLPRVVSTAADLAELFTACPLISNGLTFCTGSLGVRADNDLYEIFETYADRVHFLHLRAIKREKMQGETALPEIFFEADHLEGDVDMHRLIKLIVKEESRRAKLKSNSFQNPTSDIIYPTSNIPMRPDHGHQMLYDLKKETYPGYSAIGRLRGLAELRGMEMAIKKQQELI
jgi:mannonate dehydratase